VCEECVHVCERVRARESVSMNYSMCNRLHRGRDPPHRTRAGAIQRTVAVAAPCSIITDLQGRGG